MLKRSFRSKCCDAKVKTRDGLPDFPGSNEVCTVSYVCTKCGEACDLKVNFEKRIRTQKKRADLHGKIIKKLVELFDGITIHLTKGVILTPKKRRQLRELRSLEQKLNKAK